MYDGVVWAETECPQICSDSPVKYPSLFEDVTEVDVGIQKGRIQLHGLHRMRKR